MSLADSGGVDEAAVAKVRELVAAGNPKKTADRVRKLDVEGGVPARMRVLLQVCAAASPSRWFGDATWQRRSDSTIPARLVCCHHKIAWLDCSTLGHGAAKVAHVDARQEIFVSKMTRRKNIYLRRSRVILDAGPLRQPGQPQAGSRRGGARRVPDRCRRRGRRHPAGAGADSKPCPTNPHDIAKLHALRTARP